MRDFTKNALSFSWAMSLFGARQLGKLLDPREVLKGSPEASESFNHLTDSVVDQFGNNLRSTFDTGDRVQGEIVDAVFNLLSPVSGAVSNLRPPSGDCGCGPTAPPWAPPSPGRPPILDARSTAGETVLITYTRGQGRFSDTKQYIALYNQIYNLDGTENGIHEGVWQALFSNPAQLLARPAPPVGPMDQPVGPIEQVAVSANTIAKWTHADGSAISSVGPAASHLIPLSDGSFLFLVITAQIITEGTGRFAGAYGLTQSLGATHVPAGVDLFSNQGPPTFPATTLDTFKFITLKQPPTFPGAPATPPQGTPPAGPPTTGGGAPSGGTPGQGATVTPNPAESHFAEVHGSRMHYIDTGVGDPVVFLHGNPTWSYLWRNVLPHVASGSRCIAPDLIGMGLSDKPDIGYTFSDHVKYLEGFLDQLGLDRYTLVMHDWGCVLGFYHAMRNQKKISGMAFAEAMLQPYARWADFPANLIDGFKAFRAKGSGEDLIIDKNAFIEQALPASTSAKLSEETMNAYRQPFADPASRRVILEFVRQLPIAGRPSDVAKAATQYSRWLQRTAIPKLFLWAQPGLINTEKDVQWAQKRFKNLKTSFLGEGIHFVQESHPVEFGQEVARWLEDVRS